MSRKYSYFDSLTSRAPHLFVISKASNSLSPNWTKQNKTKKTVFNLESMSRRDKSILISMLKILLGRSWQFWQHCKEILFMENQIIYLQKNKKITCCHHTVFWELKLPIMPKLFCPSAVELPSFFLIPKDDLIFWYLISVEQFRSFLERHSNDLLSCVEVTHPDIIVGCSSVGSRPWGSAGEDSKYRASGLYKYSHSTCSRR